MQRPQRSLLLAVSVLVLASTLPASADWLILRGGKRIETKGPWIEHANNTVTFTEVDGHRSSVLLSLVDSEATRQANGGRKGGEKAAKAAKTDGTKAVISDDNTKRVDDNKAAAIARNKEYEENRRRQQDDWKAANDKYSKSSKRWTDCQSKYPNDYKAQRQCADN